jgi:predicted alpha-1,2-mannosidase
MKPPFDRNLKIAIGSIFLSAIACTARTLVDYVNPLIGTSDHGHVFPGASLPFGMMQLSPDTRLGTWDGCSGYHYSDTTIIGFSHNHLTGTGIGDLGNVMLMPTVGPLKFMPGEHPGEGYRSRFSHDQEEARPGYYRVLLQDYNVNVELTATRRSGLHRYTFPQTDEGHVILDLQHGINNGPTDARITIVNDHTLTGYRRSAGWGGDKIFYFVIEFSRAFNGYGLVANQKAVEGKEVTGKNLQAHLDFKTKKNEKILARVALSTVNVEGARKNLESDLTNWDFDGVAAAARKTWNEALSATLVESKDHALLQTYYTALYHSLEAPTLLSDADGQVRGPDGEVHQVSGFDYYSQFSFWDTFRAEHPLLTLVQPNRVNDFVNTCLAHYKFTKPDQHFLPVWANAGKETGTMIGNHSIPVIVDAYLKGFRKWDAVEALADMDASTSLDRQQQDAYREIGYVPLRGRDRGAAKTLEYAYDDACIARLARAMGKTEIADAHAKRAHNWKNVLDPSTGFMRGRSREGAWLEPFDPNRIDTANYAEANSWQYSFFVPQDIPDLIEGMGGDEKFVAKLDQMFDPSGKIPNSLPDITGVIGMYAHGNEPCHHVAYLYNYAGQPWKTQATVRKVATLFYNNSVAGLCGNDDCGQMSAWYVFTALGFYPVDSTSGVYVIGSPLMDKASLVLDSRWYKGGQFKVIAKNNSSENIYIQSATLNGRPYLRSWITQGQIVSGGTLVLQMGPQPNAKWGADKANRPE